MADAPIRLVLADDHPIVLHGLIELFDAQPDLHVVRSCRSGDEALEAVRDEDVDVLVLDISMPGRSGFDVMRSLAAKHSSCRVIVLTATLKDAGIAEAVRLGAHGLVLKDSAPDVLIDCVRRVHRGEHWVDRPLLDRAMHRAASAEAREAAGLTSRELEIVRMVAEGRRNREIATRLSISEGTVKIHLHNVYEKLGVDGRLELVLYAQERGLV